jgi:hypothetical protein
MGMRLRRNLILAVFVVGCLSATPAAWAQDTGWSFLVTPQLWLTHIEKNGFAPPVGNSSGSFVAAPDGSVLSANPFGGQNSEPVDWIYPQWGIQIAAQKGRLTLAGAFQRVDFDTRTDVISTVPIPFVSFANTIIDPGQFLGRERLSSQRFDVDVAASYAFLDVIPQRLDVSVGLGAKVIYAEATRRYEDLQPELTFQNDLFGGLYAVCSKNDLSDCRFRQTVRTTDWIYGLTIPTNMTFHLGDSWLLPFSVTPFVGAETRDDHDVVYRFKQSGPTTVAADRLDGTTVAYGVTADVTLRYLVNDALSVYAGGRVQYIKGHETYLAYGPIIGMSVRFGGK